MKAAMRSERIGLSNTCKMFIPLPLMLLLDESIKPKFVVASCVIPLSRKLRLERSTVEGVLELPGDRYFTAASTTRGFYYLGEATGVID